MAEAAVPVDLRNPGQVFACLGLMEAAEVLCGPCEGGFDSTGQQTHARFVLRVEGDADPAQTVIGFLAKAQVVALAPRGSELSTAGWKVPTETRGDDAFPAPIPASPATLPIELRADGRALPIEHWLDSDAQIGRDNVKFWAGAAGYPGAALARDALACVKGLGANALADAARDPFAVAAPMSSSFRFDWRRDYIPLDAGFSPNVQGDVVMVGYPLVELLAAIGLQNARPARIDRRDKLAYRYGVWGARLPTVLARPMLGGEALGFPIRRFRMRLDWPGQEGQARAIIDAQEDFA